jgi:uncharacterized membrane protein YfcA
VLELAGAFGTGLAVGAVSAVAGIGGGVLMVPFLYLVYHGTPVSVSAQTVVAHATSLGVAFVASSIGTWRYSLERAIVWKVALAYALPGIATAYLTARVLTQSQETLWLRGAFGIFLLISAADMVRRAERQGTEVHAHPPHAWTWLVVSGAIGGAMASLLGIGGGLIAVPVLLYVGRLPIRAVAPTALAGVCLTTLAGAMGYALAGPAPPVSWAMAGYVDLRMTIPLALGAALTVPLGVRINRLARPRKLYWIFAALLGAIGVALLWSALGAG